MSNTTDPAGRGGLFALVLRVFLGGLFIFAAGMKLRDPQVFVQAVMAFKILPDHLAVLATFAVPWVEMIAGVLLVLGLWTRAAALVVSVLLVMFIAGMGHILMQGEKVHCSCFGKFEWPCDGPVGPCQLVRNGVLLLVSLTLMFLGPGRLAVEGRCSRSCA